MNKNQWLSIKLALLTLVMFGFGYALVPLYDVFCDITGLNGKTGRLAVQAADDIGIDFSRTVTVEFIATVNSGLPWQFAPTQKRMEVHPGALNTTTYIATNVTQHPIVGQAVPSVAPGQAASYFNKTECFCFTNQTLNPKQTKQMPVRFIVDPHLPENISVITLSYTFFKAI